MRNPKTCIICGGATGSREHVFPAALGGRRTNKGIYCGTHNGEYSPLAANLSNQFKAINALLGVRGDHADQPHAITVTDQGSGRPYQISGGGTEVGPEVVSETRAADGTTVTTMAFSNERQVQAWLKAKREAGESVSVTDRSTSQRRFLDRGHVQLQLGGADGLRSIAYVAQTFLAHHFPVTARLPELTQFLRGTLSAADWAGDAWWAPEPDPSAFPPQAFSFGHRVVVGLDLETQTAYARVSLFSTFHFAVQFGTVPVTQAQAVLIDIDPLAEAPPRDIVEQRFDQALGAVRRPADLTRELADGIHSGRAQAALNGLMKRIAERDLFRTAEAMLVELRADPVESLVERERLFARVVDGQAQRVLNLVRYVAEGLRAEGPVLSLVASGFDFLIAPDPASESGLSQRAEACLELAKAALVHQLLKDDAAGHLDRDRMAMLIGGGPGAAIVGQAVLQPLLSAMDQTSADCETSAEANSSSTRDGEGDPPA